MIGQDPGLRANQWETVANLGVAPSNIIVQYLSGVAHSRFLANLKYHCTKLHDATLRTTVIVKFAALRIWNLTHNEREHGIIEI